MTEFTFTAIGFVIGSTFASIAYRIETLLGRTCPDINDTDEEDD